MTADRPTVDKPFAGFTKPRVVVVPAEFFEYVLPTGLHEDQLRVLLYLFYNNSATRQDVAAGTALSAPRVLAALENLINLGYAEEIMYAFNRITYGPRLELRGVVSDEELVEWKILQVSLKKKHESAKRQPLSPADSQRYKAIYAALFEVTALDDKIVSNTSRVGKLAKELLVAGYTGAQVRDAYRIDGIESFWSRDFRSGKGKIPVGLNAISATIAVACKPVGENDVFELSS